jgi:hypothetical protein
MAKRAITLDTVRDMALALPGVQEGTSYGAPAWLVHGRMFACQPSHRSAEPGSLVVRVDFDQREELLAAEPETYYVTDHYVGYTSVLVRLSRVHLDAMRDLLRTACNSVSAARQRNATARKRRLVAR